MFDLHCLSYKSDCFCVVMINTDKSVVHKAAGYLPQHLPALFPPPASSSGPNISLRVFSGGFSGCAEKEEGSLPPAAVRGLKGLSDTATLHFIHHLWLSQLVFAPSMLWLKAESSWNHSAQSASLCGGPAHSPQSLRMTLKDDSLVFQTFPWSFVTTTTTPPHYPSPPLLQDSFHGGP